MIPARLFTLGAALLLAGCSDPIYQREKFQAEATEISISDSETSERYNWDLQITFLMRYRSQRNEPYSKIRSIASSSMQRTIVLWREVMPQTYYEKYLIYL